MTAVAQPQVAGFPRPEMGLQAAEFRYDLSPLEVDSAIWNYVVRNGTPQAHRLVGVLLNSNEGPVADAARTRECAEFQAAFPSNTPEWMQTTYADADKRGRKMITIFDLGDPSGNELAEVAGVMSYLDKAPYMSLEDASTKIPYSADEIRAFHGIGPHDKVVDILTVAIAPEYRARLIEDTAVMAMLEGILVRIGVQEGWEHVVSMIDSRARRVLDSVGIPFKPMHDHDTPFEYFDSMETFALYGKFEEFGPGVANHYRDYRWSWQRVRDALTYFRNQLPGGDKRSERYKDAVKRIGTFIVARNVASGRGVTDRAVLPPAALSVKFV